MRNTLALPQTATPAVSWIDRLSRALVHRSLRALTDGRLTLVEGTTRSDFGTGASGPPIVVHVNSPRMYRSVALGGTVGAGAAYIDGLWSADDLPALVRLFAANRDAMFRLERGLAVAAQPFHGFTHFLRRNTRSGSRRNIEDHYDLGNEFYRLFLDETMAYSCGVFESEKTTMRQASEAKFERLCRKLRLSEGDHLLEIGTGWGGFAIHAARNYGCRVTTTTISKAQYRFARTRVETEGLSDRIDVVLRDYRDLDGVYDKLVSIEMIEAVGDQYYDTFFDRCSRLLAPDGIMALQTITIADQEFGRHRREVDFIKRFVFPGSCIPSVTALVHSMTGACDLRLFDLEDITRHYVTTLREWRKAFWARIDQVREQKFSERFVRKWDFYLAYCEGGFAERYLGNVQMVLAKPDFRANPD